MASIQHESDRRVAHRLTKSAGSNFSCAMLFLPRPRRQAMEAVYAFTRHTDDLVDDVRYAGDRAARLDRWQALLTAALDVPFSRGA